MFGPYSPKRRGETFTLFWFIIIFSSVFLLIFLFNHRVWTSHCWKTVLSLLGGLPGFVRNSWHHMWNTSYSHGVPLYACKNISAFLENGFCSLVWISHLIVLPFLSTFNTKMEFCFLELHLFWSLLNYLNLAE